MNLTPNMKRLADDLTASRLSCEEEWPGLLVIWVGDDMGSDGIETGIEPHVMLADDWGEDTLRPYRIGYYSREEYEGNRDALWMATALNLAEARAIIGRAIAHAEDLHTDHKPCPDCEYGWNVAQRRPCPTCHGTAYVNRHKEDATA